MRTLTTIAALALSLASLTACGASEEDAYCKDLKSAKASFDNFGSGSPDFDKLDSAFKRFHSLADEAPEDVKSDWKTLDDALTSVEQALDDAGVSFADLPKLAEGQVPEGADAEKVQALVPKLAKLGDEKVQKASDAIEKHAKDTCDITLGS